MISGLYLIPLYAIMLRSESLNDDKISNFEIEALLSLLDGCISKCRFFWSCISAAQQWRPQGSQTGWNECGIRADRSGSCEA